MLVGYRHLCVGVTKAVTKPVTKPEADVTKVVTKVTPVTKVIEYEVTEPGRVKLGRPAIGERAMTAAERMVRMRARRKGR